MHGDIVGVIISVLFISVGYVLHFLIKKKDAQLARKVLHIWVGNWFFIFKYFFDSTDLAILGLFAFAAINLLLELNVFQTHSYGTIYYPLSIIVLLCFYDAGRGDIRALGCAIVGMAYGDGLAAIIGSKVESRTMPYLLEKTVLGSFTMFVISTIVLMLFDCPIVMSFVIGLAAAFIEAYAPFGLDNIFVPLGIYLLVSKLC